MVLSLVLLLLCCTGCAAPMATSSYPDQERRTRVPTVHATGPFVRYAETDEPTYQFVGTPDEITLYLSISVGSNGGFSPENAMALIDRIQFGDQLCAQYGLVYTGFYGGGYGTPRTTPVCHDKPVFPVSD